MSIEEATISYLWGLAICHVSYMEPSFKPRDRHMGVVDGVKTTFSDEELADFGLAEAPDAYS